MFFFSFRLIAKRYRTNIQKRKIIILFDFERNDFWQKKNSIYFANNYS